MEIGNNTAISELIARLDNIKREFGLHDGILKECMDALAAQAQEIERLKGQQFHEQINLAYLTRAEAAEARVRELEQEIERLGDTKKFGAWGLTIAQWKERAEAAEARLHKLWLEGEFHEARAFGG